MKIDNHLLEETVKIAKALTKMFSPYCEIVVHDLRKPDKAIIFIGNSLTGRKTGDPTTNIGRARIKDKKFPEVLQNYQGTTPDGRLLKSTSIGIKNHNNKIIGAICFNFNVSVFNDIHMQLNEFLTTKNTNVPTKKYFISTSVENIKSYIDDYCKRNKLASSKLSAKSKKKMIKQMKKEGLFNIKKSVDIVANLLGISRASIYHYLS